MFCGNKALLSIYCPAAQRQMHLSGPHHMDSCNKNAVYTKQKAGCTYITATPKYKEKHLEYVAAVCKKRKKINLLPSLCLIQTLGSNKVPQA